MVLRPDGAVVRSLVQVVEGDALNIRLSDGVLGVRVETKSTENPG